MGRLRFDGGWGIENEVRTGGYAPSGRTRPKERTQRTEAGDARTLRYQERETHVAENPYEPPKGALGQTAPYSPIPAETLRKIATKQALRKIKTAWVAAIVSGVMTLAVTLLSITGTPVFGANAWGFLDVALIFGLAFGLYRKSRASALVILLHFILSRIYLWQVDQTVSLVGLPLTLVFLCCYVQGVIGTFRYHHIVRAAQGGS